MAVRILLIEDDESLGRTIVAKLRKAGYELDWWREGRRLAADEQLGVQLVILDIMLPGAYGLDVLRDVRKISDVPVLVLSARSDARDKVRALELGADVNARVDLGALVERVIVRHRPIARQLGVELAHGLPPETVAIDGDETLLEQALNNLVYNAIRYNRRGGHVAVTLDLDGDGFRIRVVDDGPGVPAGELEHLGERGYRLDEARQRDATGQGIGLDIASRVAEMHGLQLEFANAEEGGLQVDLRGSP